MNPRLRQAIYIAAEDLICRSCSAKAGWKCETRSGKTLRKPHERRLQDAVAKHLRTNPTIIRDEDGLPTKLEW